MLDERAANLLQVILSNRLVTFKCTTERVMKRLANKIFKTLEKENGEVPESINQEIPNYKEIEDHKEAKSTMKSYHEETITKVRRKCRTIQ